MTIHAHYRTSFGTTLLAGLVLSGLSGCSPPAKPVPTPSGSASTASPQTNAPILVPVAGVQDIMRMLVDPAADALWASVSTTVTAAGEEDLAPSTPEEWEQVHGHALTLIEASNLLLMEGRHVVREGVEQLEDHGTPGNLTAAEAEAAINANRALYVGFVTAMRSTGQDFLSAIEAQNTQGILDAGHSLEQICEGCHLKFWYPGQVIPPFPDEAAERPAPSEAGLTN